MATRIPSTEVPYYNNSFCSVTPKKMLISSSDENILRKL